MTIQYDDKGKIFTNIISKNPVPATIQTLTHLIHGLIYVRQGERIKDELARPDQFIAVTHATVFGARGEELYQTGFMIINFNHIVWLIPDDEVPDHASGEAPDEAIDKSKPGGGK
jgi:hypothetical protein